MVTLGDFKDYHHAAQATEPAASDLAPETPRPGHVSWIFSLKRHIDFAGMLCHAHTSHEMSHYGKIESLMRYRDDAQAMPPPPPPAGRPGQVSWIVRLKRHNVLKVYVFLFMFQLPSQDTSSGTRDGSGVGSGAGRRRAFRPLCRRLSSDSFLLLFELFLVAIKCT